MGETNDFSLAPPLVPCLNGDLLKTELFFGYFLTSVEGAATEFLDKSLPGGPLTLLRFGSLFLKTGSRSLLTGLGAVYTEL